ncbi:MAG: hypothetical protein ACXWP5_07375, partial [Bdellovibrionota bacterium]
TDRAIAEQMVNAQGGPDGNVWKEVRVGPLGEKGKHEVDIFWRRNKNSPIQHSKFISTPQEVDTLLRRTRLEHIASGGDPQEAAFYTEVKVENGQKITVRKPTPGSQAPAAIPYPPSTSWIPSNLDSSDQGLAQMLSRTKQPPRRLTEVQVEPRKQHLDYRRIRYTVRSADGHETVHEVFTFSREQLDEELRILRLDHLRAGGKPEELETYGELKNVDGRVVREDRHFPGIQISEGTPVRKGVSLIHASDNTMENVVRKLSGARPAEEWIPANLSARDRPIARQLANSATPPQLLDDVKVVSEHNGAGWKILYKVTDPAAKVSKAGEFSVSSAEELDQHLRHLRLDHLRAGGDVKDAQLYFQKTIVDGHPKLIAKPMPGVFEESGGAEFSAAETKHVKNFDLAAKHLDARAQHQDLAQDVDTYDDLHIEVMPPQPASAFAEPPEPKLKPLVPEEELLPPPDEVYRWGRRLNNELSDRKYLSDHPSSKEFEGYLEWFKGQSTLCVRNPLQCKIDVLKEPTLRPSNEYDTLSNVLAPGELHIDLNFTDPKIQKP